MSHASSSTSNVSVSGVQAALHVVPLRCGVDDSAEQKSEENGARRRISLARIASAVTRPAARVVALTASTASGVVRSLRTSSSDHAEQQAIADLARSDITWGGATVEYDDSDLELRVTYFPSRAPLRVRLGDILNVESSRFPGRATTGHGSNSPKSGLVVWRVTFLPASVVRRKPTAVEEALVLTLNRPARVPDDGSASSTPSASPTPLDQMATTLLRRAFPYGPLHFTALVSPTSGDGHAVSKWERIAVPLLRASPHTFETIITTRRGHAEDYARSQPLRDNEVLVAAGGDGMIHELVNGLDTRAEPAAGFFVRTEVAAENTTTTIMTPPRLAHFPVGSGCAFAKEFQIIPLVEAALGILHCQARNVDLFDVTVSATDDALKSSSSSSPPSASPSPLRRTAFLSACFASMAAVDIESERLRWLGNGRFVADIVQRAAVGRLFYPAKLRYRAATRRDLASRHVPVRKTTTTAGANDESSSENERLDGVDTLARCLDRRHVDDTFGPVDPALLGTHDARLPVPANSDDDGWVSIEHTSFGLLYVSNLTHMAQDWLAAPFASPRDGCLDLVYSEKGFHRAAWVRGVPSMMASNMLGNPWLRFVKCKEIEIALSEGYFSLDGENTKLGAVRFSTRDGPNAMARFIVGPPRR